MKSLNVLLWMQQVLLFSQWFTICNRAQAFAIQPPPVKDNNHKSRTAHSNNALQTNSNFNSNSNSNSDSNFNSNSNQDSHHPTTNELLGPQKQEHLHDNDKQHLVKLEEVFQSCLSRLEITHRDNDDTKTIQQYAHKYANFVLESMTNPRRHFHNVQHIFHIMNPYFKQLKKKNNHNNNNNHDDDDDDDNRTIPNDDPLLLLAALFHDVVYYNVDHGGLSNQQLQLLENIIAEDTSFQISNQKLYTLSPHLWSTHQPPPYTHTINNDNNTMNHENDSKLLIQTIARIFGYTPNNDNTSKDGETSPPQVVTNEFLSAICAAQLLHSLLHPTHILQIAIAIEATIPFRPILEEEDSQTITRGPLDQLYDRVLTILLENENPSYKLTTLQCRVAVQRASKLAFWDLANFATPLFLDYSYTLIPEQYTAFHHAIITTANPYHHQHNTVTSTLEEQQQQPQPQPQQEDDSCPSSTNDSYTPTTYTYTFRDYYQAIQGQYKFFSFLANSPKIIFPVFQGVPSHIHYLQDHTIHNLKFGQDYMATKLLAASILISLFDDVEEHHLEEEKTPHGTTATSSRTVAILFPNTTQYHDAINLLPTKLPTRSSLTTTTTTFEDDNDDHQNQNTTTTTTTTTATKKENNNTNSFVDWGVYERLKNGPHNKQMFHWFDIPQSQLAANLYVTLGGTEVHKLVQEYCGNVYPQLEAIENDEHSRGATQKSRLDLLHALPQPWVIDLLERLLQIPTMNGSAIRSKQLLVMLLENEFGVKVDR